jgi:hypothetical protein
MPTILPPHDDYQEEIEGNTNDNEYVPPDGLTPWENQRRVDLFLNVPDWKCICGLTMMGRVLKCVRANCNGVRPSDWRAK